MNFSDLPPERRREIAKRGADEVTRRGTRHHWTSETAREAALKSVEKRRANKAAREAA